MNLLLWERVATPRNNLKRRLAQLTVPIFIETLLVLMLGAVDTFMLARYSDAAVAAVGVVNQIFMVAVLVFEVINMGTAVLVSQYVGARLPKRTFTAVIVSIVINLVSGVAVSAILFATARPLLEFMRLDGELLEMGCAYMRIIGLSAVLQAVALTLSAALRASNHAFWPMAVVAVVNVINIAGNYALIFGHWGAPALGVEGAALSTAICRGVSMLLLTAAVYLILFRNIGSWRANIVGAGREFRNLLRIGLPSAGEEFSYNMSQLVLTYCIGMLGMEALATRTYAVNIIMFVFLFCIAISHGGAIVIGQLVGDGRERGAFLMGRYVMRVAAAVTLMLSVIVALSGRFIISLLTDNPEIIHLCVIILYIDVALEVGRAINIYAVNALRAVGDVNFPFYVGVIVMWSVAVVGGYLLGIIAGFGIIGMWVAFVLDENIRAIIFVRRWNSMKWAGKGFIG